MVFRVANGSRLFDQGTQVRCWTQRRAELGMTKLQTPSLSSVDYLYHVGFVAADRSGIIATADL